MTTANQGTVCNPYAKPSAGKPVYNMYIPPTISPLQRYHKGTKNLNRSRDHNHAHLRVIFHSFGKTLTEFDSSSIRYSWDMDGAPKFKMGYVT